VREYPMHVYKILSPADSPTLTRTSQFLLTHSPLRELWYLADFLTDLAEADDVREGLAQWAAGTYSGPHGFKRRVRKLSGDSDE